MSDFKKGYDRGVGAAAAFAGADQAGHWIDGVEAATDHAAANMRTVAHEYRNVDVHYLKGWLAESWHESTFNIDAARRQVAEHAERLASNALGSPDLRVHAPSGTTDYQSKYYRSAEATAKAQGSPDYAGQENLVPSDQLDGVRAEAHRQALRNAESRPDQAERYADVREHASGAIHGDNAASEGLAHKDALTMAKEAKRGDFDPTAHGLRIEDQVGLGDVALQAVQAGAMAAVFGAAAQAVPYVARAIRELVRDGTIDEETFREGAWATAKGGAHGALRGAVAAGIVAAGRAGLLGEALKTVAPPVVGAVVAVAFGSIVDGFALANGTITPEEFGRRMTTNVIVASAGTAGAVLGQTLIPVPILGALIGGIVGSAIGSVTAGGLSMALDRLSNVEFARAHAELMQDMLDLMRALQVASQATEVVLQVQVRLARTLAESASRWRAECRAAGDAFDRAARLGEEASVMGREQDAVLLAVLARDD